METLISTVRCKILYSAYNETLVTTDGKFIEEHTLKKPKLINVCIVHVYLSPYFL